MNDMADWLIENGIAEIAAHEQGACDFGCPYCAEEEALIKRKSRLGRKKAKIKKEKKRERL